MKKLVSIIGMVVLATLVMMVTPTQAQTKQQKKLKQLFWLMMID